MRKLFYYLKNITCVTKLNTALSTFYGIQHIVFADFDSFWYLFYLNKERYINKY